MRSPAADSGFDRSQFPKDRRNCIASSIGRLKSWRVIHLDDTNCGPFEHEAPGCPKTARRPVSMRRASRWQRGTGMNAAEIAHTISNAYEAVGNVERWPNVIDNVRQVIGADAAVQFSSEASPQALKRTQTVSRRTTLGIDQASAELHAEFAPVSPIAPIVPSLSTGSIHAVYTLVLREEFNRSFFYDHCVRPTGMTDALFGCLSPFGPDMVTLNFMKSGCSFENLVDRDLAAANVLMLHLARIFRINRRLATIGLDPDGVLATLLNSLSVALLCVGSAGDCLWANSRGERLLGAGDGLKLDRHRQLCGTTRQNAATVRRLLDDVRIGLAASCSLARPSGLLPFSMVSTPYAGDRGDEARALLGIRSRPVAVLAIHEPEPPGDDVVLYELRSRLEVLFGLTAGEARVAVKIYTTPGLQAVADQLGVGRPTVQTHLRRVFEKMGVNTQSELSRRMQALVVT